MILTLPTLSFSLFTFSNTHLVANLRSLTNMSTPPIPTSGDLPIDPDLLAATQESTPSPPPKRRKKDIYRPARNSLYDLMYQHAGTSLFVRPIFWTDMHTQLLGGRFEELPPCDTPLPPDVPGSPPSRGHLTPSRSIQTLSNALTEILLPTPGSHTYMGLGAVKTVLSTLWPEPFSASRYQEELHLYFGGRVYRDAIRAQVMWNFPAEPVKSSYHSFETTSTKPAESFGLTSASSSPSHNPANLPMMCYMGKNHLAGMRKNLFRIARGPKSTWNGPVHRLQQLRSKMLMPCNADHDPLLVGMFLAMAQRHFYGLPGPSARREHAWKPTRGIAPNPTFHDLKLRILTHDDENAEFIVYTATVTADFLQRFHNPFEVRSDDEGAAPGMKIEYTRVRIWPILGLRERLGKALGQDIVGPFDPNEIETWEDDPVDYTNEMRKRDALSEVINGSFKNDTDAGDNGTDEPVTTCKKRSLSDDGSAEPSTGGKKRCLSEGELLGLVGASWSEVINGLFKDEADAGDDQANTPVRSDNKAMLPMMNMTTPTPP